MLNELLFMVYAGVLAMMAVKNVGVKTTPWLVAYVCWLVGCGLLAVAGVMGGSEVCQYVFGGLACLSAVASTIKTATAAGALPVMSNLLTYAKAFVERLLFWPVLDYEDVYSMFNK
jgi:hypothetical protein